MKKLKIYKRTYKGLHKRWLSKKNEIKYPKFQVGDIVQIHPDIMDIDARMTSSSGGYIGEQVRRRERFKFFLRQQVLGEITHISMGGNIFVKFKPKSNYFKNKHNLDQPILLYKHMIQKYY